MTVLYVLIAIAAGLAIYWFVFRKKTSSASPSASTSTKNIQYTVLGIEVASETEVSYVILDAVDRAWKGVRDDAVASGYTEKLDPHEYRVYIASNCKPSPEQGIPSFLVRADNYDGTEFDQFNPKGTGVKDGVGEVYAAEQVVDVGVGSPYAAQAQVVACPDIAENASRYGFEHVLAFHNDSVYYDQTKTHAEGTGHPILPQPPPFNPTKVVNGIFVPR